MSSQGWAGFQAFLLLAPITGTPILCIEVWISTPWICSQIWFMAVSNTEHKLALGLTVLFCFCLGVCISGRILESFLS